MLQSVLDCAQVTALRRYKVDSVLDFRNRLGSVFLCRDGKPVNAKTLCAHVLDIQRYLLEVVSCIANLQNQRFACCTFRNGICINHFIEFRLVAQFVQTLVIANLLMNRHHACYLVVTDCEDFIVLSGKQFLRIVEQFSIACFKVAQVNYILAIFYCAVLANLECVGVVADCNRCAVLHDVSRQVKRCACQLAGRFHRTLYVFACAYVECACVCGISSSGVSRVSRVSRFFSDGNVATKNSSISHRSLICRCQCNCAACCCRRKVACASISDFSCIQSRHQFACNDVVKRVSYFIVNLCFCNLNFKILTADCEYYCTSLVNVEAIQINRYRSCISTCCTICQRLCHCIGICDCHACRTASRSFFCNSNVSLQRCCQACTNCSVILSIQ